MNKLEMNKLEVLTKARALISKPENWCTGALWRGAAFCARGAILAITDSISVKEPFRFLIIEPNDGPYAEELVKDTECGLPSFPSFKVDDPNFMAQVQVADYNNSHSHADVLAMFDRTIARLKREEVIEGLKEVKVQERELETA